MESEQNLNSRSNSINTKPLESIWLQCRLTIFSVSELSHFFSSITLLQESSIGKLLQKYSKASSRGAGRLGARSSVAKRQKCQISTLRENMTWQVLQSVPWPVN